MQVLRLVVLVGIMLLEGERMIRWMRAAGAGDPTPPKATVLGQRFGALSRFVLAMVVVVAVYMGAAWALPAVAVGWFLVSIGPSREFATGVIEGIGELSERGRRAVVPLAVAAYFLVVYALPLWVLAATQP
jgi:hypothetical protein